jgi:phosphatidylinositol-3,4,5-trisphosphate 3-phosphatase/dual-specificity protein phosphatase PTEN
MSFPSDSFFESIVHNKEGDISEYFNQNHPNKYLIFNLSGIPYKNIEKFHANSVITYFWPDHKAPPLYDIFTIITQAFDFLDKDIENVVCVNCLAGKGRTGTICCILLQYSRLIKSSTDANNYFSTKRFGKLNEGVQQPSQVRYIQYFDKMLYDDNFNHIKIKLFEIKSINISGIKSKNLDKYYYKIETVYYKENQAQNFVSENKGQIVVGDVTINIYKKDQLKAWIFFNTSFLEQKEAKLIFTLKDIDPRVLNKKPKYQDMLVEINICPYSYNNAILNMTEPSNKSNNSFVNLLVDDIIGQEISKIKKINEILDLSKSRNIGKNKKAFFGDEPNDLNELINPNINV